MYIRSRSTALFAPVLLLAAVLSSGRPDALGDVPESPPSFSTPLAIDNTYFPVSPRTIKVFLGRDEGVRVTLVVTHLDETRDFSFGDSVVACRAVQEHTFARGRLVEEEVSYYAQADDGSVWSFGQTEVRHDDDDDDDDDNDDDDDSGGWIVGSLAPTDPAETLSVGAPALVMPSAPAVGDVFFSENFGPGRTQTVAIRSTTASARIRGQGFQQCVRVKEMVPGEARGETKWYAPGVGLVRERGRGTQVRMNASTLRRGPR